ncbi:methyl-accepting chemotaxis protein [Paenibacillus chartarius]|uniref:Methyl-accepting chemotaxis protein n=1 Tax=Paenibacillus chartarius TaxID=747481 RepID=A0ABV6DEK9_9BACL
MKLTIGKKLGAGFIVILLLLLSMGAISTTKLIAMGDKAKEIEAVHLHSVQLLGQIKASIVNIERLTLRYVLERDTTERSALETQINNSIEALRSEKSQYAQLIKTDADKAAFTALEQSGEQMKTYTSALLQSVKSGDAAAVEKTANEMKTPFNEAIRIVDQLTDSSRAASDQALSESLQLYETGRETVDTISILALILAALLSWIMTRMMTKPIVRMSSAAKKIAAGDLTSEDIHVGSTDELGELAEAFNQMNANLRTLIRKVGSGAEQVAASAEELTATTEQIRTASEQIAAAVEKVAHGSGQQALSIHESNASFQEMASGMKQIAVHVESVNSAVIHASAIASEGNATVQSTVDQMNSIHTTVAGLARSVHSLRERSANIGQIVEVITGIARQTNLLSLNAAIEAARVGDSGSGFAVVAKEVRKLAEQSAQSAEQIAELIGAIQEETRQVAALMETGTHEVSEGIEAVHLAGESFRQIQKSVNEVAVQIQEVSAATEQITASTEQVAYSFSLIADITEQTTEGTDRVKASVDAQVASMLEISVFSAALSQMSEDLQNLIMKFKV